MPDTMSSTRRMSDEASMAVLIVWIFTAYGSQICGPSSDAMSQTLPVSPSMPHVGPSVCCLARSSVKTRITFAPQLLASVRGMTSIASATARSGYCAIPAAASALARNARETAISAAPPPGSSFGSRTTLRMTCIASCRFRSTSISTSFEPPRSRSVHALGSAHSSKNAKYSSPIFRTSNRPQPTPTSDSWTSSVREQIVAPHARATRLLSVFRRRRNAEMFAFIR
mmetsp:Transcript_23918/g.73796  ORF Transcript_23918/g.73796 Transcript_23918/m.73796 type:complete len:226 (+) Transcript_23918:96-773(+)